jgi:hypothetical protein
MKKVLSAVHRELNRSPDTSSGYNVIQGTLKGNEQVGRSASASACRFKLAVADITSRRLRGDLS